MSGERYAFKSYFRATPKLSAFPPVYSFGALDSWYCRCRYLALLMLGEKARYGSKWLHTMIPAGFTKGLWWYVLLKPLFWVDEVEYAADSRWWNQKTTTIIFFILAILSVLARTTIQLRYKKKFSIDDAFLYFAVICLCAAVGLLWSFTEAMYFNQALFLSSATPDFPSNYEALLDFLAHRFHKTSAAYLNLAHTTIFAVKFSFLFFFRLLVRRVPNMIIYWWTIFGIMIVAWAVTLVVDILPCPYFDIRASKTWLFQWFLLVPGPKLMHIAVTCTQKSSLPKIIGLAALGTILDIITDILSSFDLYA